MRIDSDIVGGMLSGLMIGSVFDWLVGATFFFMFFTIIGLQTGVIIMQQRDLNRFTKERSNKGEKHAN